MSRVENEKSIQIGSISNGVPARAISFRKPPQSSHQDTAPLPPLDDFTSSSLSNTSSSVVLPKRNASMSFKRTSISDTLSPLDSTRQNQTSEHMEPSNHSSIPSRNSSMSFRRASVTVPIHNNNEQQNLNTTPNSTQNKSSNPIDTNNNNAELAHNIPSGPSVSMPPKMMSFRRASSSGNSPAVLTTPIPASNGLETPDVTPSSGTVMASLPPKAMSFRRPQSVGVTPPLPSSAAPSKSASDIDSAVKIPARGMSFRRASVSGSSHAQNTPKSASDTEINTAQSLPQRMRSVRFSPPETSTESVQKSEKKQPESKQAHLESNLPTNGHQIVEDSKPVTFKAECNRCELLKSRVEELEKARRIIQDQLYVKLAEERKFIEDKRRKKEKGWFTSTNGERDLLRSEVEKLLITACYLLEEDKKNDQKQSQKK